MCYQTKLSNFNWSNAKFKLLFGIRIDEKTHNWVIFRNEINLGFSYMTFCVQDTFERINLSSDKYMFDLEGFNYILNRNSYFTINNG